MAVAIRPCGPIANVRVVRALLVEAVQQEPKRVGQWREGVSERRKRRSPAMGLRVASSVIEPGRNLQVDVLAEFHLVQQLVRAKC